MPSLPRQEGGEGLSRYTRRMPASAAVVMGLVIVQLFLAYAVLKKKKASWHER